MGYACPVCDAPQADEEHLADHLAITAIARGGDHKDWLDERVPEWEELGTERLAARVATHAEQVEYPQVFEDTTGSGEHTKGGLDPTAVEHLAGEASDADVEAVIEEARELTERRREDSETE
ncbi:MAG: DUF5810 domain-containing protein [Salinirussus sp.]